MIGSLKEGGDLLFHKDVVPSAQTGLTSLFGMVRGEPRRYNHLSFSIPAMFWIIYWYPLALSGKDPHTCEDKYRDI